MRVLLVDPHYHLNKSGYRYSLGLAYIASQCVSIADVETINFELSKKPLTLKEFQKEEEIFLKRIERLIEKADVVGINTTMGSYGRMLKIAEIAKKAEKLVIVGGPQITFLLSLSRWWDNPFFDSGNAVDVAFKGEADYTILSVLEAFEKGYNFSNIPGISYISKGQVIHNREEPAPVDLAKIKPPIWDLLGIKGDNSIAFIGTSRGCRYACKFCDERILLKGYRYRSTESVTSEIKSNLKKYAIRKYRFTDSCFSSNPLAEKLCDEIKDLNANIAWIAYARVDEIAKKKALLSKMKLAGCRCVYFGLETGDEYLLQRCNKKTSVSDMRTAFRLAREVGLKIKSSFIIGLPGETQESIRRTISLAKELNPDIINWHIFAPSIRYLKNELKDIDVIWKNVQTDMPDELIAEYASLLGDRASDLWVERHIGFKASVVPQTLPRHISGMSYEKLYYWLREAIRETKQNTETEPALLDD